MIFIEKPLMFSGLTVCNKMGERGTTHQREIANCGKTQIREKQSFGVTKVSFFSLYTVTLSVQCACFRFSGFWF